MDDTNTHTDRTHGLKGVITLTLIMVMVALGAYTYLAVKKSQNLSDIRPSISVNGEGEVIARPDIATFSFSVIAEGDDAGSAQNESAAAVNAILDYLKEEGIAENDIKTVYYNLTPRYDYLRSICNTEGYCPPGERVLRGYEVNQTIQVKVRSIDEAGDLISGVGTLGATNVSNLQFTIDDEDALYAEARARAIEDAKEKAQTLANDLDVELVRVTGFWEGPMGLGGGDYMRAQTMSFDNAEGAVAPDVPVGENTFASQVTITYEIR